MKILRFLYIFLIILLLSFSALAQNKNEIPGADASLEDIQKWLVKILAKNGNYTYRNTQNKLTDLKFAGCYFSYRVEMISTSDPTFPDIADQKIGAPPGARAAKSTSIMFTSFNLTDMDSANLVLKPALGLAKDMTQISVLTLGGKPSVYLHNYFAPDPNKMVTVPGNNSSKKGSMAQLIVKKAVAEQIKAGLIQAITLCQAGK